MATPLQVFLISPGKIVVYSFTDPSTGEDIIFNAGSLTRVSNPEISEVTPITGQITHKFNVKPSIIVFENGKSEVVYAPSGSSYLYSSDGSKAKHNKSKVTAISKISIPDIEKSSPNELLPMNLAEPNIECIQKFVDMSFQGDEYPTSIEDSSESPKTVAKSPSPRMKSPPEYLMQAPNPSVESTAKITQLREELAECKQDIADLRSIVKALNQRIYQIYPVDLPTSIRVDKKQTPVVSLDEITKKTNEGKIERWVLDPMLQPYAGSHRSHNRLLTFYEKDGSVCHVRAEYDAKTSRINPPT